MFGSCVCVSKSRSMSSSTHFAYVFVRVEMLDIGLSPQIYRFSVCIWELHSSLCTLECEQKRTNTTQTTRNRWCCVFARVTVCVWVSVYVERVWHSKRAMIKRQHASNIAQYGVVRLMRTIKCLLLMIYRRLFALVMKMQTKFDHFE